MEEKSDSESSLKIVSVKGEFYSLCTTDKFKKYVRDAVNDELFWRDIIQRLSIGNTIQTELNSRLPSQVQNEARRVVSEMVTQKLNDYTHNQLPSHVSKELSLQITNFLTNHVQMNQILTYHSEQLSQKLLQIATDTLNRLVNEPQYQMTTNAHLQAMQQKCDGKISDIQIACNNQLSANSQKFNIQLDQMKQTANTEMAQLKDKLEKLDKQNKKLVQLEGETSSLRWMLGGVTTIFSVVVISMFYTMKR
ncbi:SH3 domain-containing protein [Fadolivirus algeromassiliense]|jgi:hypothetical protein|uniref:SH3 domain-containing protein n=1 Tax=Fadolivirus FV1/VV64 TaxID=3070911 RepID=A0A7D3V5P0_9VIRU|nr:SH3 domain-containing protein [Fadolivirus algeromassiliense]QKF94092.1 SH3 domain-containing protein [Fadolivirus FV1/VV64]